MARLLWYVAIAAFIGFSLVGAGLIVLLSLSGAIVWTSRNALSPSPQPIE